MEPWPKLDYEAYRDTGAALHLYSQIVGKYRLAHAPWMNHSWQATFAVTPRGITTGLVPDPQMPMAVTFDFLSDALHIQAVDGREARVLLGPMSVAEFFARFAGAVEELGGRANIHAAPNEMPDPTPFREDRSERPWNGDEVRRTHRALVSIAGVFEHFRSGFIGKVSPVHLFWGAFDLAVTRFSGREAPLHPGGFPALPDAVTREAYSHEVASAGFWPGGNGVEEAMFYSYAYPTPDGFASTPVRPDAAYWSDALGEFLLSYEAVREAPDPADALLQFLSSTYQGVADTAGWDRAALECPFGEPRRPRPVPSGS